MPIKRNKLPKIVTPAGTAVFPRVNVPDTKFDKDGAYTMKLRLPEEQAMGLIATIKAFHTEAYAVECADKKRKMLKLAELPFGPSKRKNEDGDVEEIPGFIDFSFKRKASGETKTGQKWTATIGLFDAAGNPTKADVWGGSTVKANAVLVPWYSDGLGFGVRLELQAVQVLKLVTKGGLRSFEDYGFSAEAGYTEGGNADEGGEETGTAPAAAPAKGIDDF